MHDGSWWFFGMHTFWWLFWIAIIVLFFSPLTLVPKQSHVDATHHANRRGERYHAHVRLVFDRRWSTRCFSNEYECVEGTGATS